MLRAWGVTVACLLLASAAPPIAETAIAETPRTSLDDLPTRLDEAIGASALNGARVSVYVANLSDGTVRYEHHSARALIPASNMKILTAVAALSMFGPTHRFETELYSDVAPGPDGSIGVLGVRGAGDPALTSEQWWRLAADLRVLGVRSVKRGLLLDARQFDSERWHPAWGVISPRAYNAPIGALNANYGAYGITVHAAGKAGDAVSVVLDPPASYLRLVNRVRTVSSRSDAGLVFDRRGTAKGEDVIVSGTVRAGADSETLYRSVLDPVGYAGSVFRMQLEANGIEVGAETRKGAIGDDWPLLNSFGGQPLTQIISLFMKYSNNAIGETLVKAMGAHHPELSAEGASGHPGNWAAGMAAMRLELDELGIDLTDMVASDGSGLSYENRLTPIALVSALRVASDSFRFGSEFAAALPIAAADGTLRERAVAAEGMVRAKTGLLTRVTSLSGYALASDGERLVFSILVNGFRRGAAGAMDAVDAIALELTR